MELKDIVSISGMSGLFSVVAKRPDGMIVRGLDDDKSQFASSRIHVFTPLDAITIYTTSDTTELSKVLLEMKKQSEENPPVDATSDNDKLKTYFKKVIPDYNEEKVYVSDIKKVVKWYRQLDKHKLVTEEVLAPKKKDEAKEDEQGKEVKEKKDVVVEKTSKAAHAKPAIKERSATHSKASTKRTGIGSKRGG